MKAVNQIYMSGKVVGTATIERDGLYYKISCTCDLPKDEIYRIVAVTATEEMNLGVCVPHEAQACLETRVSVRRLGDSQPQFRAVQKNENLCEFYEVSPEQPFADVEILRECCFIIKEGKAGVIRQLRL